MQTTATNDSGHVAGGKTEADTKVTAVEPVVTIISKTVNQTIWSVKFPSVPSKPGATYAVHTYPDSDLLHIQTGVRRWPVSKNVAHRLTPVIRAALAKAGVK